MNFYDNQKLLAKIDFMPAYFIMPKQNQELMEELDQAQASINLENPYFTAKLHQKYYEKIESQAVGFTREEVAYIQNAGKVKVFYNPEEYPMEYQDEETGEAKGVYLNIIEKIFHECGLEFEAVPQPEGSKAWSAAADNGEKAVVCVADFMEIREKYELDLTDEFFTANYSLNGKRGRNVELDDSLKVAVVDDGRGGESRSPGSIRNGRLCSAIPMKNVWSVWRKRERIWLL